MSHQSAADPAGNPPTNGHYASPKRRKTAEQRLQEIRRALQRFAHRKLKGHEQPALARCHLLALRSKIGALDITSKSDDVVRLENSARRARNDFERIVRMGDPNKPKQLAMSDIEAEVRAHG